MARRFTLVIVALLVVATAVMFTTRRSEYRVRQELSFRQNAVPVILAALDQITGAEHAITSVRLAALTDDNPTSVLAGASDGGTGLQSVAIVRRGEDGSMGDVVAARPAGTAVAPTPTLLRAAALAADSGEVRVTPPSADGTVRMVAAVYTGGQVPLSVGQRRAMVRSYIVGTIRPVSLLEAALASDPSVSAAVELRAGSRSLIPAADRPDLPPLRGAPVIDRPVPIAGDTWHLLLGYPDGEPGVPASAWFALVVGLAVAAVAGGLIEAMVRNQRRALAAAEARAREVALIAELGPVLQNSLDLGDLLPAVLVRLADEVDADRLSVLVVGDGGRLTELFAIGSALPDAPPSVAAMGSAPDVIEPGRVVSFPLQRAGRTIGALRLRPHQRLEGASLAALRAAVELIAASVANALLFQREQDTVVRLRDVDQLKTAFLGTASHELRTPVTAIRGFSELLMRKWDELTEAQRVDFVRRIARNASSLSTLVGDLLDFARIERGDVRLAPQVLDLGALVTLLAEELASVYTEHTFVVDAPSGTLAHADADAIERIVSNLVANAAKFAPMGSTVSVHVAQLRSRVELIVDDEGPGVPVEERERIFSRFYRGEGEAVVRTRGVGIGLSVVHDLTTRMGGTVTVSEAPTGGARFRVELPAATSEEAAMATAAWSDAGTGGER